MLSPAEHDTIERTFREIRDDNESRWLLKYLPHPPTPLQDWADWLILAEGLTALDRLLQRVEMPSAELDSEIWRIAPRAMDFGQWLHAVLTAGDLTVGSVPMNAVHASTRKVGDGYLVVVKQGLLLFVRKLVTIYEYAGRRPGNDDKVAQRLQGLLNAHARYGLSGLPTRFDPEISVLVAVQRVMAMTAGLSPTELMALANPDLVAPRYRSGARPFPRNPRGLTRDILAPLFVVLHELAHIYHGDADMSAAESARLNAEYDELAEHVEQDGSVLFSTGSPGFRSEWWADVDALEAIIEMQRFVELRDDGPLGAFSPDVNEELQTTALESAYLALIALHLVHETTPQEPQSGRVPASRHPAPYTRLDRLAGAANSDATVAVSVIEAVEQLVEERLGPAVRRVLGQR